MAETDLKKLLTRLAPRVNDGEFVFCFVSSESELEIPEADCLGSFHELEGRTILISKPAAIRHGLKFDATFSWITLDVHSSLEAIGLTAAVSKALADQGIACNMIAAFHHDHLFVPVAQSKQATEILKQLSEKA